MTKKKIVIKETTGLTGLRMILKGPGSNVSSETLLLISQTGEVPGHSLPTHSRRKEKSELGSTSWQPAEATYSSTLRWVLSPGPATGWRN